MTRCCSYLLIICFWGIFSACSPKLKSSGDDYRDGVLLAQTLIQKYGERTRRSDQEYLTYLRDRLVRPLPAGSGRYVNYQLVLLDTDRVMAFSPGGGLTLISKGLIKSFNNESELAFAVAHELAHQYLDHTRRLTGASEQEESFDNYRKDLELEADAFAAELIIRAGYDPTAAVEGLERAYRNARIYSDRDSHPSLGERAAAVQAAIAASRWSGPGTIDRRDFQLFRRSL